MIWTLVADRRHEAPKAFDVVLGERVLDRHDRIARAPADQQFGEPVAVEFALLEAEPVASAAAEFRGGDVERDGDVVARRRGRRVRSTSISASSACSLLSNAGHQPPSSATPMSRPRSAMILPAA